MDEQVRRHLELATRHLEQAVRCLRYLDKSEPGEDRETLPRLSPCAQEAGGKPRSNGIQ